jgi:hypothetical protein
MSWLETGASIAEIGTAVVAVGGGTLYAISLVQKRAALERYLKQEWEAKPRRYGPGDNARRTSKHLVAALKMSEEEILRAAFRSKRIRPSPEMDPVTKHAKGVFLEYKPK